VVPLAHRVAASAAHLTTKPACRKRVREPLCVFSFTAGVIVLAAQALAQGPVDGAIRGHVSAVCGLTPHRCMAGEVRVHVTSPDLGIERDVDTDRTGNFMLLRLPPGEYDLRATSQEAGEQIAVARLDLEGGDIDDVMLTLGPARPNLSPVLSLKAIQPATFQMVAQLEALPVEGRRWEDLVELDSEANGDSSPEDAGSDGSDADDPPNNQCPRRRGDGAELCRPAVDASGVFTGWPVGRPEFSLRAARLSVGRRQFRGKL
jgi:hypothetical protein